MPIGRDTHVPSSPCPFCGADLDHAFSAADATPSPGDLSVCIVCASALVFDDALHLQPLSPAEFAGLDSELQDALRRHQAMVRSIDRRSA
jgi:hypothetical protein